MIAELLKEKEERAVKRRLPFLSFSQIDRYFRCPEQYRLYYIEGLRLKIPKANLIFGQILHHALAGLFREKEDPVKYFLEVWDALKKEGLTYGKKESWDKFRVSGEGLLEKFLREELPRITEIDAAERKFELNITGLDLPLFGIIDLVANIDGKKTVADFKSAASEYEDYQISLSDQLTAYKLAEPEAEQLALWVLIKTKEPKIEWYPTNRSPTELTEFLWKAGYAAREIKAGHFYKRSGMHCSWCDFLPVCLGDKKKAEETLVRVGF